MIRVHQYIDAVIFDMWNTIVGNMDLLLKS